MAEPQADNPGVLVFPPGLVAGTLAVGMVLQWLHPWRLPIPGTARIILAVTTLAIALALGLWDERALHSATSFSSGFTSV